MPRGELFGRRIRVVVGGIVVADIDPAIPEESATRSLDVEFTTEAHTKLEPLVTTVKIYGLNRVIRASLIEQQKTAASESWEDYQKVLTGALNVEDDQEQIFQFQQQLVFNGLQVRIEAGYQDDFALIADAQTVQDGIKHSYQGGYITDVKAQDGRYPWQNSFVSEEVAPGVTFRDMAVIEQLSEGFIEGTLTAEEVEAKAPELLVRKDFAGYANGKVLFGDSKTLRKSIVEALGLTAFYDRGKLVYLDVDAVTSDQAVVLKLVGENRSATPTPGGLLTFTEKSRGFVSGRSLLNHRLTPGRQVFLRDELDKPIGEGTFRVDYVKHSGSTISTTFNSDFVLRPTNIPQAKNVG